MRERALWRVGPYLRPHLVKIVFIAVSALTSIACQLTIPLDRRGRDRRPDHRRRQGRARPPVRARGRARRHRDLAHLPPPPQPRVRRDRPRDAPAQRPLRAPPTARGRLPRPVAVGPAALARQFRHLRDPPVLRLRRDLPARDHRRGDRHLHPVVVPLSAARLPHDLRPRSPCCCSAVASSGATTKSSDRIQDQTGDLTTAIEESAKGIRVIKAFGRGNEVFARYDAQCLELRDHANSSAFASTRTSSGCSASSPTSRSASCSARVRSPSVRVRSRSVGWSRSSRTS